MNTENLDDLRRDLRLLADSPHPPLFADPAGARGRARRRAVRRGWTVSAAILASAAVVVAGVAVAPGGGSDRPMAETPGTGTAVIPLFATFGWLPPGFSVVYYSGFGMGSSRVDAQLKGSRAVLTLLVSRDSGRVVGKGSRGPGRPPAVAGIPAVWGNVGPRPQGDGLELVFQIDQHLQGSLSLSDPPKGFDALGQLAKVAGAVRLGSQPMTFPFQLRGVPDRIKRLSVGIAEVSPEIWSAPGGSTMLSLKDPGFSDLTPPSKTELFSVIRQPLSGNNPYNCKPNTTVAGHPAYYADGTCERPVQMPAGIHMKETKAPPQKVLCVMGMPGGLQVCLSATGTKTLASLQPGGGLIGLFRRSAFFGTDQSTWSPRPLG